MIADKVNFLKLIFYIFIIVSDGTEVSSTILQFLEWEQDSIHDLDDNSTCVVWKDFKILNSRCNTDNINGQYYSGTKDILAFSGSPNYDITSYHRGYLCEARPIHTVSVFGLSGGHLCVFPFR